MRYLSKLVMLILVCDRAMQKFYMHGILAGVITEKVRSRLLNIVGSAD